jgi:hypothetical protein
MARHGAQHLQATGQYPEAAACDKLFAQMHTAATNSGLSALSSNKDVGLVTMEKLDRSAAWPSRSTSRSTPRWAG